MAERKPDRHVLLGTTLDGLGADESEGVGLEFAACHAGDRWTERSAVEGTKWSG